MNLTRKLQTHIEDKLSLGGSKQKAIVVYGPRQVGKTTLIQAILAKFPKGQYYNCDYLDVQQLFSYEKASQLETVLEDISLLVLDEAQRIENIGLVLKILVDEFPHLQVIATGSSSFELSNEIAEPLTGRKHEFYLYPFSYWEINQASSVVKRQRSLEKLLRFGSYPNAALATEVEAKDFLKELTGSYLFKDIFAFQTLKRPEVLKDLLRLLAFQIGAEVSYQELATNLKVDQTVIQRYLQLLEQSFVIYKLEAFSRNLRKEISKSRKYYFWDLGIRNTLIQNYNPLSMRDDVGSLWENYCVMERVKYLEYNQLNANQYFWRTYDQKEIDYLEENDGQLMTYEIKWRADASFKKPTEFLETYPNSKFELIDRNNFEIFIPL